MFYFEIKQRFGLFIPIKMGFDAMGETWLKPKTKAYFVAVLRLITP